MKVLPERPCPSEAAETPRFSPTVRFVLEICTEDFFDHANSSRVPERIAGYGDETCSMLAIEDPNRSSNEAEEIAVLVPSDDDGAEEEEEEEEEEDDDDLQWANAKPALRSAPRNSGYGRGRDSSRGRNLSGREKLRIRHKTASSPRAIAQHQHPGPIRPHSVPFSGSLTPRSKKNFRSKPCRAPSIIPVNFRPRKGIGFNGGDPMSPDVTCLGRIKSRKLDSIRAPRAICAEWRMGKKVRCLDAKNELCERACKCRRKARRRLASADVKRNFAEDAQTRRERAASLATSLTDILEEMRHSDGQLSYEPSAPPPNSLLLMRGFRERNTDWGRRSGADDELPVDGREETAREPPPNSLLLMRGRRVRGGFLQHAEAHTDEKTSTKTEHEKLCAAPMPSSAEGKSQKRRAFGHISLLDLIEEEDRVMDEGVSASELHDSAVDGVTDTPCSGQGMVSHGSENVRREASKPKPTLYRRRCFADLSSIEISRRTKFDG